MHGKLDALIEEFGERKALALALREHELRTRRKRQQAPGGLLQFVREYWPVVEPIVNLFFIIVYSFLFLV